MIMYPIKSSSKFKPQTYLCSQSKRKIIWTFTKEFDDNSICSTLES